MMYVCLICYFWESSPGCLALEAEGSISEEWKEREGGVRKKGVALQEVKQVGLLSTQINGIRNKSAFLTNKIWILKHEFLAYGCTCMQRESHRLGNKYIK